MAERRAIKLGFTLVLLVITILQSASTEDKCRSGCSGHLKTFKYVEGTTYNYNLDGSIDIALSNAEGQQSSTKLKAQVSLTQLPQCSQLLKLHNVQVIGPDAKKYNNLADIEKPIRINLQADGRVADSICADPSDTQNSLNIKRAVASIFQAYSQDNYETDVFGLCPTEFTSSTDGANGIVNKYRNLNKCAFRENIKQDFMATTFNLNSEIKSSPILNGEYTSEQKIKNGILDHAVVTEHYLYVPFSVGKNGAKATVSTKLQFTGTSKQTPANKVSVPKSIIFETPHLVNTDKSNADAILAALKEVKNSIDLTVGEKSAKSFVNLIKILRVSSKNDILAVYGQVRTGAGLKDPAGAKKVYLDAIFRAGTGDTIEASIELFKNKELNEVEQKLVYLSLAFVKHATPASLKAATILLDNPNLPREGYLGIGTLAGRYCREHSCKNNEAVNKLSQKLISKLGDGKPKNRQQENVVINVLKALANVDLLNDQALPKVLAIAQDKKVANRLRVAALETLLVEACKDKVRDTVLNILKDIQQDSEIRIKAYLLLAQCPNGKVANAIKTLFENEPSLQVGGFIASHLRGLKASTNPDKELAKQHLGQIVTTKKFPIDLRKYSFNNEFSYTIDTVGLASSTESNVIYSQNSFLPRSTNLNLTAQVFGHTFNFLEIGTRQENFEKLLEHYLGPLGVLGKATPEELLESGKTSIKKIVEHFQQRLSKTRGKRDVSKSEIESIGKQVQIKTNELNTDLDLDLSVKLFGSELLFLSINDQDKKFTPDAIIDHIFDCLDGSIAKAKNFEKTIQSNVLFLDSEFSYPTSLGFPLKLSVEGSSTVQLKASGSIDVKALLSEPTNGSPFKLSLIPSANIEIEGSLTVDALVVEGGLKVSSSLHTATGAEAEVVYSNNGQGLDVKFSLPVQKQKLISATHDIVFNVRPHGQSEVNKAIKFGQNKDFSICIDHLSPFIGLEFCADINSPPVTGKHGVILPFPLSGNAKFSVGINREDLSHYHLKKLVFSDNNKVGAEFVLETIGANNNQKLSVGVEAYLVPETYVKASILSPIITASVEGRVTNNNQEKSISLQFQQDQLQYLGKVGVSVSGSPSRAVYKPLVEYNGPSQGNVPVQVQGQIIAEHNGNNVKYTFENVQVTGINGRQQAYSIQGNVGRDSGAVFADLTVSDGVQSGSLKGKLQAHQNQLKLNAEVKNTINPQANFNIKYDYKNEKPRVSSNLQLIHGADLSSKTNKLTINNEIWFVPHHNSADLGIKNKLSYPGLNLDTHFDFSSKQRHLTYEFDFQYLNFKVGSELDAKVNQKTEGDYDIEFEIYGNDNKLEIESKREIHGDKSKIHKSVAVNGNKFEVSGTIKHHCKPDDVNVGTDLDVKFPGGRGDAIKFQSGLAYNLEELDSHLKIFTGNNVYVDVFLKGTKGGNANGNLKVNLNNILVADGQLRATNGVGTGNILIHFVRFERKLKGEVTFTCADPIHNYVLTFYPNFEKDANKFVFTTNNEVKENSFDSKNQIELFSKKLEFNFKGHLDGKVNNGKLTSDAELILPDGLYFAFKINREFYLVNGVGHGNAHLILEQRPNKNAGGSKFTVNTLLKSVDVHHRFIDVTYNIVVENPHGQILNKDLTIRRVAQGDQIAAEINVKASGSLLAHPVEFKSNALYKGLVGTYHVESSRGGDSSLLLTGKYDYDCEDHDVSNEISAELKTPSTTFSVIKLTSSSRAIRTQDQGTLKGEISLFVDDNGSDPDATVDVKFGGEAIMGHHHGQFKGSATLQKQDPINFDVSYKISEEDKAKTLNSQLNVQYNKDKYVKSVLDIVRPEEHKLKVNLRLDASEQPTTTLDFYTERTEDNQYTKNEMTINTNNKKFVVTNELNLSKQTPGFKLNLVMPDGKIDGIAANLKYISEKDWESTFNLAFGQTNFLWESHAEAHIVSIDEFTYKSSVNCAALKLDKIEVDVQNKAGKGTKNILVSVTSAGKNLLSGSTAYRARTEGDKYIVEGSGTYQVREESKQGNFKFIRQNLSGAKNGEDGIEISFNGGLGNQAIDSELKITNKQFRLVKSYCEEKQQCAHVEIDAKTIHANAGEFNHEIEIAVDLRKLGLSHEFGLKGVTARKSFVLDHTVDIYFQSKENKYQYSVYVHPTEAGIQLTTPKRIVALESTMEVSRERGAAHPIRGEIAFYLDKKNQPNQKTSLSGVYHCEKPTPKSRNCDMSTKFTHPALGKDLSISYNYKVDVDQKTVEYNFAADIFRNPNHKIVFFGKSRGIKAGEATVDIISSAQLKSEGLNVDISAEENIHLDGTNQDMKYDYKLHCNVAGKRHESQVTLQLNPSVGIIFVKALGEQLVNINAQLAHNDNKYISTTNIDVYGATPLISIWELTNYNTFKYTLQPKNNPSHRLQVDSHFLFGSSAELNANIIEGSNTYKLIHYQMLLDEKNFLKSTSEVSAENIKKYFLSRVQLDISTSANKLKTLGENYIHETNGQREQVVQLLQQNLPDLKPLKEYYQGELQKVRQELISDKTLEDIKEFLNGVFGSFIKVAEDILVRVNEIAEKVCVTAQKQFARVIEITNKQIVPRLTEIVKKLVGISAAVLEQSTILISQILGEIGVFIEAHQAEFRQISNVVFAITHDIGQFIYRFIEQAQVVVNKEWRTIYDEFKRLPIAEELKDKYKQLLGGVSVPDAIINTVKQVVSTIKDALPSEDLKKIVTYLGDYIEKKLKGENVDDYASIQKIVQSAVEFINKLVKTISGNKDFSVTDKTLPLSLNFLYNLPKLVAVKFSPASYFRNGEFPNLSEVLTGLSFNPEHWIPPYQLDAFVAQGQHIFTFDGKHITFPGNCNYLLARDAVNGNFSIVGTYENGFLTALVFSDKHDVVTIKKGGLIHLNNAAHELPVHKPQLDVYRLYDRINIVSAAGVEIICGDELLVCGIHVNGYYHGQLRGILGNGNYEPFDDYTIPNGKIVTSESEFGNSYKLGNCPNVQTVDHHHVHAHNPVCNKLFDHESPLSLCYKFVNPENFKMACDHGLAANIPDTERAIAVAYVASCNSKFIPVEVPPQYVKCENAEQEYAVGDSFSTKTPGKSADIVIVIDQIKSNEVVYKELVQPLITQIPAELASKGVSDVKFHIILYGGEYQKYPSHYTVQGKLAFKGKSPAIKFTEEPTDVPVQTGCPQLDQIIWTLKQVYRDVNLVTGLNVQEVAYAEAYKYPFRADAIKSIIAVVGKPCEVGSLLALQKVRALLYTNKQISVHLITPINNFAAKDSKHTKNIIGFDSHNVFTFSDIKKKPEGSSELHGELNYDDYCIDFTLKNHGNVFVTNNFVQAKAASRKQFVQSATHNIVNHLVNQEQALDCTCKMYSPYAAKNVCSVVYTKDKAVGKKSGHH